MARVSITEAAKLAGVSRSGLYQTYLNKGVISVSKDSAGKKFIETSELLRVFGQLKGDVVTDDLNTQANTPASVNLYRDEQSETAKDTEIKMLREQLEKCEQREQWLQSKVDSLSDAIKLLEGPKNVKRWWHIWK